MNTQQQIEQNIKANKETVAFNAALNRLYSNRDFKQVIMDGYLNKEAVRLVHLKAAPAMQTEAHQQSINSQIDAIGNLLQFFNTTRQLADIAARSIAGDEETLAELMNEVE